MLNFDSKGCVALDHSFKSIDHCGRARHRRRQVNHIAFDKFVAMYLMLTEDILQHAMFHLKDEFCLLMERNGESFDLT
ncbi:exocyst complex component [Spatholobus suberectus]|nr:exocyst complex component [Spatholobus suberectus]